MLFTDLLNTFNISIHSVILFSVGEIQLRYCIYVKKLVGNCSILMIFLFFLSFYFIRITIHGLGKYAICPKIH